MTLVPDATAARLTRRFTSAGRSPYDEVSWERRDARLVDHRDGSVAFEQIGVEFPVEWSATASNIVAQKYFRGPLGTPRRESSLRQVIDRVVGAIAAWGRRDGYFADDEEESAFADELRYLLLHQRVSFNSPVWFNIGVPGARQQAAACFILDVEDELADILEWYEEEGTIFKGGSGAGANLSKIRSSRERLSGGGVPSGPVSFMRGADASAGTIKSGGTTRRAAKMVILDADHPDVEEFIWCKAVEERKARVLRDAGFDMDLDGRDAFSVQYQNANNSVRLSDDFMEAALDGRDWELLARTTGEVVERVPARKLLRQIAEAAWECADPGVQFDTTINRWNTTPNAGRIEASNPCSEHLRLANSACNLASLNLLRFLDEDGRFDVDGFEHAVRVVVTAQDVLVGASEYPTEKITEQARASRDIGIGYTNLGACLMALGLPYDSDPGRAWAASVTALLTGAAAVRSTELAERLGPAPLFHGDADGWTDVYRLHLAAAKEVPAPSEQPELHERTVQLWEAALAAVGQAGARNAELSVAAPTGCLVGGTLVPTDRGLVRLHSIADPYGAQWQDVEVAVGTDDGPRSATKFFVNGVSSVVRIDTARGYQLAGTPQHRIKVVDDKGAWVWRRLSDLRPGDSVPLSLEQLFGEPQAVRLPPLAESYWTGEWHLSAPRELDAELAELVGYFMGDGSLHARGLRFCVAPQDDDVVEHLRYLGKSLFGIEAKVAGRRGYTEVAFHSVRLVEWWEACGFVKHKPHDGHVGKGWHPHIPDAILHSNDPAVYQAFLRGLFEADGTVTSGVPHWSSTCEPFARDVQALLLALGFPTTAKWDTTGWGDSRLHVIRLLNTWFHTRFLSEVGFLSMRKQTAISLSENRQAARRDSIPVSRELLDRVIPVGHPSRAAALGSHGRNGSISRRLAVRALGETGDDELRHLCSFFYDRVGSTRLDEEALTYDLSVPSNVTYVANGFVSHNTISFMMDADTTGIEPDLGLIKFKKLVGGGSLQIVNATVPRALRRLGYDEAQVADIVAHVEEHHSALGAPHLDPSHLAVFACAMGDNVISYGGHLRMMAAIQPFFSGAMSKTVNVPETTTVDELEQLLVDAWRMGIKCVAVYRDNCKVGQPLSTGKQSGAAAPAAHTVVEQVVEHVARPVRERLPRTRTSRTFEFRVADCKGFVTVGEYADGRPGELFIRVSKQGSTLAGIMDAFAISVSHGLQYGVPLRAFVEALVGMRFEPAGITDDPEVRIANSLIDYLFRRLALEYLPHDERVDLGVLGNSERMQPTLPGVEEVGVETHQGLDVAPDPPSHHHDDAPARPAMDAPLCMTCGVQMTRAGSCFVCQECGATSGCS